MARIRIHILTLFLLGLVLSTFPACASKKSARGESDRMETGEYLLFLSNLQGNPLCMFVSIQKMKVFPWITAPKTRWRVHSWMVFPGAAQSLFTEKGKNKKDLSVPLKWTKDSMLFTTDQERFVFFKPLLEDKLLLLTESIFADRVRKSGEQEIRYSLIPSTLYWNNLQIQGQIYYEKLEMAELRIPSSFLPLAGVERGGKVFAIWVPGGMFLYLEENPGTEDTDPSCSAILQDRRGRWEETYDVTLTVPDRAFAPDAAGNGQPELLRVDIPFWRMTGELEVLEEVRLGLEAVGQAEEGGAPGTQGEKRFWTSLQEIPQGESADPLAFCLLKGRLKVEDEVKSVYGVGIMER